jgi:hypothetical protein
MFRAPVLHETDKCTLPTHDFKQIGGYRLEEKNEFNGRFMVLTSHPQFFEITLKRAILFHYLE